MDNHLGSSAMKVDGSAQANVISYEEYHPYGSTAFHLSSASSQVSAKRYRYTGKEKDEETGLYYHGARYYAPWLGRWTAADPAGLVDGLNLYRYSRDNPIRFSDPSGTKSDEAKKVASGDYTGQESQEQIKEDFFVKAGVTYEGDAEWDEGQNLWVVDEKQLTGADEVLAAESEATPLADLGPAEESSEAPPADESAPAQSNDGGEGDGDGNSTLDNIQLGLDVLGLIPGIGSAADVVNAGISLGRGDYVGAAVNLLGAIPGVGDAAKTAIKAADHAADVAKATKAAVGAGKEIAEGAVGIVGKKGAKKKVPSANKEHAIELRKNLKREGRGPEPGEAAGHIAASGSRFAKKTRELLERYGVNIDDAANGIPIGHPRPHNVTHTKKFHSMVNDRLAGVVERMTRAGYGRKAIRAALRRELRKIGKGVLRK